MPLESASVHARPALVLDLGQRETSNTTCQGRRDASAPGRRTGSGRLAPDLAVAEPVNLGAVCAVPSRAFEQRLSSLGLECRRNQEGPGADEARCVPDSGTASVCATTGPGASR